MTVKALADDQAEAYKKVKQTVRQLYSRVSGDLARLSAGPQSIYMVFTLMSDVLAFRAQIGGSLTRAMESENKQSVVAFIQEIENDSSYDAEAEYNELISRLTALLSELEASIPVNVDGLLLAERLVNSSRTGVSVTATSSLLTAMQNTLDHIE